MKSVVKSSTSLHRFALTALLATIGASAMAQATPAAPAAPMTHSEHSERSERHEGWMGKHDPAKMQARIAKHQAELKANLKITPAQEGAWASYTAAMQPPAGGYAHRNHEQRAEMDKLTTPQRIDKMREMRSQRMAEMSANMNKRGDATKALYSSLTPEQQSLFDAQHKRHHDHERHGDSEHRG
jgi:protein CpxP